MQRSQVLTIIIFLSLFSILYFGCDNISSKQKALEKSRAQNLELINIDRIKNEAIQGLTDSNRVLVGNLLDSLKIVNSDSGKQRIYEQLASLWFSQNQPLISADYAEKIAELSNNEEAWQITGTSYLIAAQRLQDERKKTHAIQKSRKALEKALSLNSDNIENRINLALSYVEAPLEENPMKGILMLLDLNKEFPDNTSVLIQLGRLALGTNQLDKAVERLTRVVELEPDNRQAHCYLEEIYTKQGKTEQAEIERKICEIK